MKIHDTYSENTAKWFVYFILLLRQINGVKLPAWARPFKLAKHGSKLS